MKKRIIALLLFVMLVLTACGPTAPDDNNSANNASDGSITLDDASSGLDLDGLGVYDGLFALTVKN